MANTSNNFSIFAEVKLDTSTIQKQLNKTKIEAIEIPIKMVGDSLDKIDNLNKGLKEAANNVEEAELNFNAANEVFRRTIDVISAMTTEVFALNDATTEFRKVSSLTGQSLDEYVSKLSEMGNQVARTGKPKCLSLCVRMIN